MNTLGIIPFIILGIFVGVWPIIFAFFLGKLSAHLGSDWRRYKIFRDRYAFRLGAIQVNSESPTITYHIVTVDGGKSWYNCQVTEDKRILITGPADEELLEQLKLGNQKLSN